MLYNKLLKGGNFDLLLNVRRDKKVEASGSPPNRLTRGFFRPSNSLEPSLQTPSRALRALSRCSARFPGRPTPVFLPLRMWLKLLWNMLLEWSSWRALDMNNWWKYSQIEWCSKELKICTIPAQQRVRYSCPRLRTESVEPKKLKLFNGSRTVIRLRSWIKFK